MRSFQILTMSLLLTVPAVPGQAASDLWAPKVELLPGTPGRADLAGEWFQSRMSSVTFSNQNTGSFSDPSGERTNIRFLPDGTFRLGWLKQSSLYNCTMHLFGYKVGAYRLDAAGLTIEDREATLTSRDNCHSQWNYKKPVPLTTHTYRPQLGRTQDGVVLVLHRPDGQDEVYQRETGKSLLGQ